MVEVAVLGATGYTGVELVRLLNSHPGAKTVFLSSESYAGKKISEVHPQFNQQVDLLLEPMQVDKIPGSVEVVFCALPHGKSAETAAALLKKGFKVIDLSADFRLRKAELYQEWYKLDHPQKSLLKEAVYGLPELYRSEIAGAKLVANPGCYPTSVILALAPLLNNDPAYAHSLIIDAKSGVSGAGREPKQPFHFPECSENFKAYRIAAHQHTPEIEQELGLLAGEAVKLTFTPHLVPMIRGILSTIYSGVNQSTLEPELTGLYSDYYDQCPFVRVLKPPALPETRLVRGSNYCDLALRVDQRTGRLIIISAIDNLVKGAAGQAVQNMNIMFNLEEELGLGGLSC
ncbi:MAG: N-acetyl-gamma-glutamyl-phosphate reductase [Bacillota bacterium]